MPLNLSSITTSWTYFFGQALCFSALGPFFSRKFLRRLRGDCVIVSLTVGGTSQVVFPDHTVEPGTVDAEQIGRRLFVAPRAFERRADNHAFELFEEIHGTGARFGIR